MRAVAATLALILVFIGIGSRSVVAQPAPGSTYTCRADADFLGVAATVYTPIPILEVQITLENRSPGRLRFDPGMFALTSQQTGRVSPLTLDQSKEVIQNPLQTFTGAILFGVVGLLANIESQRRWTAYAEANIFKSIELAPESTGKSSLFFRPNLNMSQFTLSLDGLTTEAGQPLPALAADCRVPSLSGEATPAPTPAVRAYVMTARATVAPLTLSVQNVEFGSQATTVTVTIENAAEGEANLFTAIADARLRDRAGKTYAVRMLRSDLADRVAARSSAKGRLVFEPLPLPPATRGATLTLPEIIVGETAHTITVELRF